jgi:hypothetical protein
MVRANCRVQFTRADIDFLYAHASKETLARTGARSDLTVQKIDRLLDDERVFRKAYEARDFARFSPHFFFYIGARWCLRGYDLYDPDLADYVASVLCAFIRAEDLYRTAMSGERLAYLVDMVEELNRQTAYAPLFDHHAHIGDYTLFLAGVFPDWIEYLSTYKRRLITRRYYEQMGQAHYRLASSHDVARKERLDRILATLAVNFPTVRRALTRLSVDYLDFNRTEAQRTYLSLLNDVDV